MYGAIQPISGQCGYLYMSAPPRAHTKTADFAPSAPPRWAVGLPEALRYAQPMRNLCATYAHFGGSPGWPVGGLGGGSVLLTSPRAACVCEYVCVRLHACILKPTRVCHPVSNWSQIHV